MLRRGGLAFPPSICPLPRRPVRWTGLRGFAHCAWAPQPGGRRHRTLRGNFSRRTHRRGKWFVCSAGGGNREGGRNPILEFAPRCGGRRPRPAVFSCDADDRGLFRGFRALAIRGEATTGNVSLHIAPCPVLFVAFQMPHDYVGVYQCPAADGTFALLIPSTDKGGYAFRRPRSTPDVVIVLRSGQRLSPRKTTSSLVNGAEFQSNAFFEVPRASCVRGTGAVCHAAS